MNKSLYILSISLALGIISCQKDEFQEDFDCADRSVAHRLTDTVGDSEATNKSNKPYFEDVDQIAVNRDELLIGVDEKPLIQIKEVSDGDDEADDGDDSKTSN